MNLTREKDRKLERAVGEIIAQRWYHKTGHQWPKYNLIIILRNEIFRVVCMRYANKDSKGNATDVPIELLDDTCDLLQQSKRRIAMR